MAMVVVDCLFKRRSKEFLQESLMKPSKESQKKLREESQKYLPEESQQFLEEFQSKFMEKSRKKIPEGIPELLKKTFSRKKLLDHLLWENTLEQISEIATQGVSEKERRTP